MPLPAKNDSTETLQDLLQRLLQSGVPPIALSITQPAYVDEESAARYVGLTRNTFRGAVKHGVFKRGTKLTPGGKYIFKISDLDFAIAKAGLSRKPKPALRGIVRQRLERHQLARHQKQRDGDRDTKRRAGK